MDSKPDPIARYRETVLAVFLALAGAGGLLFFLILITGGLLLYVVLALIPLALLGLFHYFLWGKLFTEVTAGEREEAQLKASTEIEPWSSLGDAPPPHH